MASSNRGHTVERRWAALIEAQDPARTAFRPRWAVVDVISLKAGEPTYFDEVKSTRRPYERFGPEQRRLLLELARRCGAEARLVHWPIRTPSPSVIPSAEWPLG